MKKTISIVAVNVLILIVLLLIVEFFLRWYVTFDPGYYTGVKSGSSCIDYPYGTVCLNSHNFPDSEFSLSSEGSYRIGYIGDSVCYGVGAGQEQRITEHIKRQSPVYVHMNFCYIGENVISNETMAGTLKIVDKYSLDHVVYLMNLNDISPLQVELGVKDQAETNGMSITESIDEQQDKQSVDTPILVKVKSLLMPIDEGLRGRSYLYTWIRNKMKEYLTVAGYEASGYKAIELFPGEHTALFEYAADKITWLNEQLSMQGVNFTLVVLPYEMQVSNHAAGVYRDLRINWEEGFTDGSAQQLLLSRISNKVDSIDARHAFDDVRETASVGEYFVYDMGDKIDWNHPNHAGHRKIADYIVQQQPFSAEGLNH